MRSMARKATGPELGASIEGTGVAHHMEGALREGNLNTVGPELRIDGRSDAGLDGHAGPRILVPPHHAEVERGEPLSTAECTARQGQDKPGQEHHAHDLNEVHDGEGVVPDVEGGGQQFVHQPKDDSRERINNMVSL